MSTDDPFDDEFRSLLRHADPAGADAAGRLEELRPRFRAARRRRQQRIAAIGSAAAVIVLVVGVTVLGDDGGQRIDLADDGTTSSVTTAAPTTTSTPTSAPDTTTTTAVIPTTTAPSVGVTTTSAPRTATSVPGGSSTPTVAAPTTVPVGGTEVVRAEGGSVTVVWTATSIRVESTAPAAGWQHERTEQKSPTRVEVRFRRDDGGPGSSSSTIDARVVDGRLISDT